MGLYMRTTNVGTIDSNHGKDRVKPVILVGVVCPGCAGPVKTDGKTVWCAEAPAGCPDKNRRYRVGQLPESRECRNKKLYEGL